MGRRALSVIVGAAFAVAVIAGCGDNGGDNGNNNGDSSASAPAQGEGAQGGAQGLQAQLDEITKATPVTFGPESPDLSDQGKQALQQIAQAASGAQDAKLQVQTMAGYPDPGKAMELAQQRAQTITKELGAAGLGEDKVQATPMGNEGVQGDDQKAVTANISVAQ